MNEHKRFWKCEACDGWFDLGTMLDREQPLPVDVGIDLCGAIAAQLILLLIISWFARRPDFRPA